MTHPIMPPRPLVANTTGLGTAGGCGDGVLIFGAIMEDVAVANIYCYCFYWLWSKNRIGESRLIGGGGWRYSIVGYSRLMVPPTRRSPLTDDATHSSRV
jgi:hypothetical protein